jgi:eukaryotic-like serine/threonine-protein kinase
MQLTSGTRVRRYEIESFLGRGGMGEVYRARDVELGRLVALKVLPRFTDDADADERVRRFVQEAKAAVALNHPNVAHLYDAGEDSGIRFIAMELIEGETLRERMHHRSFPVDEALDVAIQIASALADAHAHGIVHRDIKPDNVMLRPDGYVKVLDFGLAKLTADAATHDATARVETQTGAILGTVHYMSPEQLCGQPVDGRTDVFSLGVLLYELLGGRRPFESASPSAVIAAILTEEPKPLERVSAELNAIVMKAIAKKRDDRFANAADLVRALRDARGTGRMRSGDVPTQVLTTAARPRRRIPWIAIGAIAILAIAAVFAARYFEQRRRVERARAELPRLEKLADEGKYFEAWDLARSIRPVVDDARVGSALEKISSHISVTTEPAGASVLLQRIRENGQAGERESIGTTPLAKHVIPKGDYVVTVEKNGFAPFLRTIQLAPVRHLQGVLVPMPPAELEVKLTKSDAVPEGMVAIEGGPYRLTGWTRASSEQVALAPFFIDRYEVTNRDFARFVREGGYRRRELWKHPFVKDRKTLSFDEAMTELHDSTGMRGPRAWANGSYPPGLDDHPVASVTWYEAAAYAEWAGKRLPTVYEWDKAARDGFNSGIGRTFPWGQVTSRDISLRANYRGAGPMPVRSLPSGMSSWGVHHMAGNVAEWLLNRNEDGFASAGGGYDDAEYLFSALGTYPGFFASPQLGFRCAKGPAGQGAFDLATNHVAIPKLRTVDDAEFARIRKRFEYEKAGGAKVVERKTDNPDWIRETIHYPAANGATGLAYLYLPRGVSPPYQVIHFIPAGDVARGFRSLATAIEAGMVGLVREGRAVFAVAFEGYLDRPRRGALAESGTQQQIDELVSHTIDARRGLDYLETRPDIAVRKLGFFAPSAGADAGLIVTALDARYTAVAFSGIGISGVDSTMPEVSRVTFAPRIAAPKLLMHGRYDEAHPLATEAQPLFDLMPEPKRIVIADGGHVFSRDVMMRELRAFFDQYLGPVR